MSEPESFDEWAICELMGHTRAAGRITEASIAGHGFLRLDVYPGNADEPAVTKFYAPSAIFALTPVSEDIARRLAMEEVPVPVHRWELSAAEVDEVPF